MSVPRRSRNGMLMYRQLPEEYRFRDNRSGDEPGDLEAYLDGIGVLLDDIRETLEQSYADAFSEATDNGREIQPWLVPYLGELLDAELLAPDPDDRNEELNATVGWYKGKGTLGTLDSIVDTLAEAESVVVEGWTRTLRTPRLHLPPLSTAPASAAARLPLGTPDLRQANRAVPDEEERFEPHSYLIGNDRIYWKPSSPRGAPLHPGAYDDVAVRAPDLRDPATPATGPHPRRIDVHVQQPDGFFGAGLPVFAPPDGTWQERLFPQPPPAAPRRTEFRIGPAELQAATGAPDGRFSLKADLRLAQAFTIVFEDVIFDGRITIEGAVTKVRFTRCAVRELELTGGNNAELRVWAKDSLFGSIKAGPAAMEMEFVTVLGNASFQRLHASDCLFAGALEVAEPRSRIRFSRVPTDASLNGHVLGASNTTVAPRFADRVEGPAPVAFGEPGSGVLASDAAPSIVAGAEDAGELGAYHHKYYAAKLRAIRLKFAQFLPAGQSVAIAYDKRLSVPPAKA